MVFLLLTDVLSYAKIIKQEKDEFKIHPFPYLAYHLFDILLPEIYYISRSYLSLALFQLGKFLGKIRQYNFGTSPFDA